MGEFGRSIHILKKEKQHVMSSVLSVLGARNYEPCESQEFDRAVAIIESGDWVSVLDSSIYDEGFNFNKALSQSIDEPCVSFDLMDGDCVQAVLWKKGRRVNTFISHPEDIGITRTKSNIGNARKWNIVAEDTNTIQSIFENDQFATDKLIALSKVLAIPNEVSLSQYTNLKDFEFANITYLYFRDATPKPPIHDVPIFEYWGGALPSPLNHKDIMYDENQLPENRFPRSIFYVGDDFSAVISFGNRGKLAKGISISVIGEAVHDGSITLEGVQLFDGDYFLIDGYDFQNNLLAEATLKATKFQNGQDGYTAQFAHAEIPHSMLSLHEYCMAAAANPAKEKNFRQFSIKVTGRIVNKPNEPAITVFVHPTENYFKGCCQMGLFDEDVAVFK